MGIFCTFFKAGPINPVSHYPKEVYVMSKLTEKWTEDKIRYIIRKLDEKTGLNGLALPVKLNRAKCRIGYFRYPRTEEHAGTEIFGFSLAFLNDPDTPEAAAVDLIRHEYAHYYVYTTKLYRYYKTYAYLHGHGSDWIWACKLVGAVPKARYEKSDFADKNWSIKEAQDAYDGKDIPSFNILSYLEKWDQPPVDPDNAARYISSLKQHNPDAYYEAGDEVLHPKRGFGIVRDAVPFDQNIQKVYICFEDKSDGIFSTRDLCKMVNGVAIPYNSRLEISNCI